MKKFNLHIITDCQDQSQVEKLAQKLMFVLPAESTFKVLKTQQLHITGVYLDDFDSISQATEISDRICSPWLMVFNREENEIELQFSRSNNVTLREPSFNAIKSAVFKTL